MKKLILTLLLVITATVASAQQKNDENFAKRLFEARLAEVCLRLQLTDEQKNKFAPIYEQYCKEMSELRDKQHEGHRPMRPGMRPEKHAEKRPAMRPGMRRPEGHAKPEARKRPADADKAKQPTDANKTKQLSDADKVKNMKNHMEKQMKAQEIRLTYADKFATVLSDKQLLKFYEVENKIQEKLHQRAFRN